MKTCTIPVRTCTGCKTEYPATLEYFYAEKRMENGLRSQCKCCTTGYNRSAKGRNNQKRYHKTDKFREKRERYRNSIKGVLREKYADMKARCNNPENISYENYGGRGIKCLFESLDEFRSYVVDELQVDPRGLQIDRIDNDGHYEKGNIRFVTQIENLKNRSRK